MVWYRTFITFMQAMNLNAGDGDSMCTTSLHVFISYSSEHRSTVIPDETNWILFVLGVFFSAGTYLSNCGFNDIRWEYISVKEKKEHKKIKSIKIIVSSLNSLNYLLFQPANWIIFQLNSSKFIQTFPQQMINSPKTNCIILFSYRERDNDENNIFDIRIDL